MSVCNAHIFSLNWTIFLLKYPFKKMILPKYVLNPQKIHPTFMSSTFFLPPTLYCCSGGILFDLPKKKILLCFIIYASVRTPRELEWSLLCVLFLCTVLNSLHYCPAMQRSIFYYCKHRNSFMQTLPSAVSGMCILTVQYITKPYGTVRL